MNSMALPRNDFSIDLLKRCQQKDTPLYWYYCGGVNFHGIVGYFESRNINFVEKKIVIDHFETDDGLYEIYVFEGMYKVPYGVYCYSKKYKLLKKIGA